MVESLFSFFRENYIHNTLVPLAALPSDIALSLQSVHIGGQRTDRNGKSVRYLGHISGFFHADCLYDMHIVVGDIAVIHSDYSLCLHIHHMVKQAHQQFVDGTFCVLCHFVTDILPGPPPRSHAMHCSLYFRPDRITGI